jgi:hypothetical protein
MLPSNIHYDPTNLYNDATRTAYDTDLAALQINGLYIDQIIRTGIKPSTEMMMTAVNQNGYALCYIALLYNPPTSVIFAALTSCTLLTEYSKRKYDRIVQSIYYDSSLMVNKWTRFGDITRTNLLGIYNEYK